MPRETARTSSIPRLETRSGHVQLVSLVDAILVCVLQVVIRPMMFVALTYDHRLIDGREAVTFLRKIKSSVEDCRTLLLGL